MDEDIDVGAEKTELIQLADEYSRMDAEDIVGGVRTRFRYREVLCCDSSVHIQALLTILPNLIPVLVFARLQIYSSSMKCTMHEAGEIRCACQGAAAYGRAGIARS